MQLRTSAEQVLLKRRHLRAQRTDFSLHFGARRYFELGAQRLIRRHQVRRLFPRLLQPHFEQPLLLHLSAHFVEQLSFALPDALLCIGCVLPR